MLATKVKDQSQPGSRNTSIIAENNNNNNQNKNSNDNENEGSIKVQDGSNVQKTNNIFLRKHQTQKIGNISSRNNILNQSIPEEEQTVQNQQNNNIVEINKDLKKDQEKINIQQKDNQQQQQNENQVVTLKSLELDGKEKKITFQSLINKIKERKRQERNKKRAQLKVVDEKEIENIKQQSIFKELVNKKLNQLNMGPIKDKDGKIVKYSLVGDVDTFLAQNRTEQHERQRSILAEQAASKKPGFALGLFKHRLVQASDVIDQKQQNQMLLGKEQKDSLTSLLIQYSKQSNDKNKYGSQHPFQSQKLQTSGFRNENDTSSGKKLNMFMFDPNEIEFMTKEEIIQYCQKLEEQRKQIEILEKEYIKQLPLEYQNHEYSQEKSLLNHDNQLKIWANELQKIQQKVHRKLDQLTLFQQSEQYRKKIEAVTAIEQLKPNQDKYGPEKSWNLSLRQYEEHEKKFELVKLNGNVQYLDKAMPKDKTDIQIKNEIGKGFHTIFQLDHYKDVEFINKPNIYKIENINNQQSFLNNNTSINYNNKSIQNLKENVLWKRYSKIHQSPQKPQHFSYNIQKSSQVLEQSLPLATSMLNGELDDELMIFGKNKMELELEDLKNDGKNLQAVYKKRKTKSELPIFNDLISPEFLQNYYENNNNNSHKTMTTNTNNFSTGNQSGYPSIQKHFQSQQSSTINNNNKFQAQQPNQILKNSSFFRSQSTIKKLPSSQKKFQLNLNSVQNSSIIQDINELNNLKTTDRGGSKNLNNTDYQKYKHKSSFKLISKNSMVNHTTNNSMIKNEKLDNISKNNLNFLNSTEQQQKNQLTDSQKKISKQFSSLSPIKHKQSMNSIDSNIMLPNQSQYNDILYLNSNQKQNNSNQNKLKGIQHFFEHQETLKQYSFNNPRFKSNGETYQESYVGNQAFHKKIENQKKNYIEKILQNKVDELNLKKKQEQERQERLKDSTIVFK